MVQSDAESARLYYTIRERKGVVMIISTEGIVLERLPSRSCRCVHYSVRSDRWAWWRRDGAAE